MTSELVMIAQKIRMAIEDAVLDGEITNPPWTSDDENQADRVIVSVLRVHAHDLRRREDLEKSLAGANDLLEQLQAEPSKEDEARQRITDAVPTDEFQRRVLVDLLDELRGRAEEAARAYNTLGDSCESHLRARYEQSALVAELKFDALKALIGVTEIHLATRKGGSDE